MSKKPPQHQELVVVTGASTGMGAATARELARRGFHVLAGVRRTGDGEALLAPGIEPVLLAITDQDHIAAFTEAGVNADTAARTIAKAATARKPHTRYATGATAGLLIRAGRFLPDRVLDRMTTSDPRKHHPDRTAPGHRDTTAAIR
ncbi:SDR family NAD(P)-dependent oxidoreductase [Streptomyces griseoviridis]|nr:SDR family NAD(P)-dependent oxidoreductase [Streptomyces griseoviridis]